MLLEVTVNSRGQITLPSAIRKALQIKDNSKLIIQKVHDSLVISTSFQNKKEKSVNDLAFGLGKISKKNTSVDDSIKKAKYRKAKLEYGK